MTSMKKIDFLIRGIIKKLNIRFALINSTATVNKGILLHSCDPVGGAVFGKGLTIAGLMSPLLGVKEKYSIKWEYSGEIGTILVDVDCNCKIRGIPKVDNFMDKIKSQNELYGDKGRISVMKFENGKILNSGLSDAAIMEISDDMSYHMSTSDQIETDFFTAFKFTSNPQQPVDAFGGVMIQEMPECNLIEFDDFRKKLHSQKTMDILLNHSFPPELKLEKLINALLGNSEFKKLCQNNLISYQFSQKPSYSCNCSYDKLKKAVLTLNKNEIKNILQQEGEIKTSCNFCRKPYIFKSENFSL